MARYKIVDDNGVYFTTHTIVEWLPVFRERKYCYQKLEYMHNNSVHKGFVEKPECWLYSSARNYAFRDDSILKIELVQTL